MMISVHTAVHGAAGAPALLFPRHGSRGLQNRNARFDSSVPRFENRLYSANSGGVEPNCTTAPSAISPHRSAGIRSASSGSVHTAVHTATAIDRCGNCGAERWFCGCYPPEPRDGRC